MREVEKDSIDSFIRETRDNCAGAECRQVGSWLLICDAETDDETNSVIFSSSVKSSKLI